MNGQTATLSAPKVQAKQTQPPPRYNEGTLVDAMQNAWRFVKDEALRERLKEAKGIGTPATRAEIIKGLKRQNLLTADGKLVVPTPPGFKLFELLRGAAPALVDPGTTAVWEKRLDDVVLGKADFRSVIDEIAGEAGRIISVLSGHTGGTVDLGEAARDGGKRRGFKSRPKAARVESKRTTREGGDSPRARKPRLAKQAMPDRAAQQRKSKRPDDNAEPSERRSRAHPPTAKMIAFAERLAKDRRAKLPPGYDKDFDTCRSFLDQNFGR